jgi:hypothetical protein
LVDALDLGSSDESCGGSSPSARTNPVRVGYPEAPSGLVDGMTPHRPEPDRNFSSE